jgi:HK97 family phage major capsid protein
MSYRAKAIREELPALMARCEELLALDECRGLHAHEKAEFDSLIADAERKRETLHEIEQRERQTMSTIYASVPAGGMSVREANLRDMSIPIQQSDDGFGHSGPQTPYHSTPRPRAATSWQDERGRPVHVLARGDRWQDLPRHKDISPALRLGDAIRYAITGRGTPEIRSAMSEGHNVTGGFLVADELMRRVIDMARAKSVIMQAGALTVPMESDTLRLARVLTDPTFEVKEENESFTGSDITFDALLFTTKTVGTLITCSRELAEDAVNFVDQIEDVISSAFATKLDNIAINGVASTHFDGILDWATSTGITETGSVAAISWEEMSAAVTTIQTYNHQPNAYLLHPDIAGDLALLTTGDGTNSAKLWLPAPSTVAPLMQLVTTNIANSSVIVGDFTKFVWAVRQGALIEVTREAGDSFKKHQLLIKLVWRGDCGAFRRDAFHRLVGVTT